MAYLFVILSCFCVLLVVEFAGGLLIKAVLLSDLRRRCNGRLVLTYDDGPGHDLEPRLLDVLDRHHAKATFFLCGAKAEANPVACELLKKRGHELGCHSYSHQHPFKVTPWRGIADMARAYQVLGTWVNRKAPYRCPYGKITLSTWIALVLKGKSVAFWTLDSGDTHRSLPNAHQITQTAQDSGGAVVLMHSFDRNTRKQEKEAYIIDLTDALLQMAKEQGWQVCTWSELYKDKT